MLTAKRKMSSTKEGSARQQRSAGNGAAADRKQRERNARQEAILDATLEAIAENGLHALTMDEAARRAGISKGALYLYFDCKEALCAAVAERQIGHFLPAMQEALTTESSGLLALRRLHLFWLDFVERAPEMFRFAAQWLAMGQELPLDDDHVCAYRRQIGTKLGLFSDSIERGKLDGSVRPELPTLVLAQQLWASFFGVLMVHVDRERFERRVPFPLDTKALIELHLRHTLRAIATERGADTLENA